MAINERMSRDWNVSLKSIRSSLCTVCVTRSRENGIKHGVLEETAFDPIYACPISRSTFYPISEKLNETLKVKVSAACRRASAIHQPLLRSLISLGLEGYVSSFSNLYFNMTITRTKVTALLENLCFETNINRCHLLLQFLYLRLDCFSSFLFFSKR